MFIASESRLLFIGDSITDCGRVRPVGEIGEGLGKGYVSLIAAHLNAAFPEKHIRFTNVGLNGNTVRDLKQRWQEDVLDLKPDYVSIMIGINDVWRQFDRPVIKEIHVHLDEYRQTLDELVKTTLPTLSGMVILSPFYIEPNASEPMRARMDAYGAAAREIAKAHGVRFVDTQAAFNAVLAHYHPAELAWDRVHPNLTGHTVIARAFLKAIEAL